MNNILYLTCVSLSSNFTKTELFKKVLLRLNILKQYITQGSRKIPPWENYHPSNYPWKIPPPPPKKITIQKISTWNIPTNFINCLSSLNTESINGGRVHMYILLPGRKILISPGRLRVFSWNFGNIDKIFIKNIFSVLSLKYKVSTHDQIAISQYR